jgi:hypothetical protein
MNLNKKIIALALASAVSTSVLATTETYNATVIGLAEPTIAETAALNFGTMGLVAGSSCVMDNAAVLTGDCDAADAAALAGIITISTVTAGTNLAVTVATGVGSKVTYVPTFDIAGGTANVTNAAADTPASVTVDGTPSDIVLTLFGSMTVDTDVIAGDTEIAPYAVTVVFE